MLLKKKKIIIFVKMITSIVVKKKKKKLISKMHRVSEEDRLNLYGKGGRFDLDIRELISEEVCSTDNGNNAPSHFAQIRIIF